MKLSPFSPFAAAAASAACIGFGVVQVQAQSSQPECHPWTEQHQFDNNPALDPAEDAYYEHVADTFDTNCRDDNSNIKSCSVKLDDSTAEASLFETECHKVGGYMWTYAYSPICGSATTGDSWLENILVCASAACVSVGAANLAPSPGLKEAMNTTDCAATSKDLKQKTTTLVTVTDTGGRSQPECQNWTVTQLFDNNDDLLPAEDAYMQLVAGTIDANCFNDDDTPKACDITIGEGDLRTEYIDECSVEGGNMWKYDFSAACGVDSWMNNIWYCASASCEIEGALNWLPHKQLFQPYEDRNLSCGAKTRNTALVKTASSGSVTAVEIGSGIIASMIAAVAAATFVFGI